LELGGREGRGRRERGEGEKGEGKGGEGEGSVCVRHLYAVLTVDSA